MARLVQTFLMFIYTFNWVETESLNAICHVVQTA